MKEKKLFDLFDLSLGMTVYHPNVGFGKDPMKLHGVRMSRDDESVRVELKHSDGSCVWCDIDGLSTAPEYTKKVSYMVYAKEVLEMLSNNKAVGRTSISKLADIVIGLTDDVQGAKVW